MADSDQKPAANQQDHASFRAYRDEDCEDCTEEHGHCNDPPTAEFERDPTADNLGQKIAVKITRQYKALCTLGPQILAVLLRYLFISISEINFHFLFF